MDGEHCQMLKSRKEIPEKARLWDGSAWNPGYCVGSRFKQQKKRPHCWGHSSKEAKDGNQKSLCKVPTRRPGWH